MSFTDSIRSCFSQYVGFSGRASRSEYWFFYLFFVLVNGVGGVLDGALGVEILQLLAVLGLILPFLGVSTRRLHDTGRSAWWLLVIWVPVLNLIILIQDSTPGTNGYGPNHRETTGGPFGVYGQPPQGYGPPQGYAPPQGYFPAPPTQAPPAQAPPAHAPQTWGPPPS